MTDTLERREAMPDAPWFLIAIGGKVGDRFRNTVILDCSPDMKELGPEFHWEDSFETDPPEHLPAGAYVWSGFQLGGWAEDDPIVAKGGTFTPHAALSLPAREVGERAREAREPFGYWIEQRHADPAFLRKPAYIPEPSDLRTVTPLYTSGQRPSGIDRSIVADLDRRRVLVLARLLPMLSLMAGGEAAEVIGYDAANLYGETMMALGIEDDDNPDTMAEVIVEMDGRSGHGILDRIDAALATTPAPREKMERYEADEVAESLENALSVAAITPAFGGDMAVWSSLATAAQEAIAALRNGGRCTTCDDTGDVHRIDGEWLGACHCPAGRATLAKLDRSA